MIANMVLDVEMRYKFDLVITATVVSAEIYPIGGHVNYIHQFNVGKRNLLRTFKL